MVDTIKPASSTNATKNTTYYQPKLAQEVQTHADEKPFTPPEWNRIERRRGQERRRRNLRNQSRASARYDMRSARGRRKTDHGVPRVETKA